MSRSWWRQIFRRNNTTLRRQPTRRLDLNRARLEDRLSPAALTDGGTSTLTINLNNANEAFGIVSNGATYAFTSTNTFTDGGVADTANFSAFGNANLTLLASGLAAYSEISIIDSATGTTVDFNNSGSNVYSDVIRIDLINSSAGLTLNGTTTFATGFLDARTSGPVTVSAGAAVSAPSIRLAGLTVDLSGTLTTPGSGSVNLTPAALGQTVTLGSSGAGYVLSQAELDNITTGGLYIGSANGMIIVDPIVLSNAKVPTLYLDTDDVAGGIIDGTAGEQPDLTVTNLRIGSKDGIGAADDLNVAVQTLAFLNAAGAVNIHNTGAMTISSVAGLTASSNTGTTTTISASSPITFAVDFTSTGDISFTAAESASAGDDITMNAGIKVESTSGNVTLRAGDNVVLNNGSTVKAATAGKTITLTAGFGDLDGTGKIVANGTPLVEATNLAMSALDSVGASTAPIGTKIGNLEAQTSTGGIFISNAGDVSVGGVSGALNGVQATTSGDIQLSLNGTKTLTLAEGTKTASGNVTLSADDMALTSTVDAGAGAVMLRQASTTTRTISLGAGALAGSLGLSDAELGQVTAAVLRIGRTDNTGDISLDGSITAHAGFNTLSLQTGSAVRDDNFGADIAVTNLAIQAATGIGSAGALSSLDINVSNLAFINSTSGLVQITDIAGGLTLKSVDGILTSSSSDGGFVSASSPLTISMNATHGGSFTYTAGANAAVPGDNLTIDNATVTLNSAINATLRFEAGDNIAFKGTGNAVTNGNTGHTIELEADLENDVITDLDGGTVTQDTPATISATTNILDIDGTAGVGNGGSRFHFSADSLTLISTASALLREDNGLTVENILTPTGNVDLLVDAGDVTIKTITAFTTVKIAATAGSIFDDSNDATEIAADSITLTADRAIGQPGATADLDISTDSVTANTTGAGPFVGAPTPGIWLTQAAGALNVTNATTAGDGVVLIDLTSGNLTVQTVTTNGAGRNVRMRALAGDLILGSITATGDIVSLFASGSITDGNGATNNLSALSLILSAGTGIGAADPLETTVSNLAWVSGTGGIELGNTGALTITSVTAFAATITGGTGGGKATVTAKSPLVVAADVVMAGDIVLTAGELVGPGDDLTVNAGIKVQSTGGNVALNAGDDIILNATSLVQAVTAGKSVTLNAGFGDLDTAGKIVGMATHSVIGTNVALSAIDGIGDVVVAITTTASNLEAETATDGIFISNTGDLSIGNVTGTLFGVQATTSGDIVLTNAGSISVTAGGENIIAEDGNVSVTANGATSDIQTGGANPTPLAAIRTVTGGDITLVAGRDVLLGEVGIGWGNVRSIGSVSINAGRDLIVDVDSFLESGTSGGGGDIIATAGRDISVLQNTFSGAHIRAVGTGDVRLTTGAGGVFTVDAGSGLGVSAGGDVTITADNMNIIGPAITAGNCVILQQKTLGNVIDLGGADGAGTLGLTDAELDLITAKNVKIGQAGGGAITITQKITLDQPLELVTGAGGITEAGLGALEVDDLILVTTGAINMNGDNKVKNLAASAGTDFSFRDLIALDITELTICGDKVTGITAAGDVTIIGNTITISKDVSADCVILKRVTAGAFDLGTTINDASIDNIKANVLQIGDAAADSITISGTITVAAANVPVVDLRTKETIANTGGTLAADQLTFAAGKAVTLTGLNTFGTVAGTCGGKLEITSTGKMTIGAVTNCNGVTIKGVNSAGNDILLSADDIELAEAVTATGKCVTLAPLAGGKINLGSEVGGSFSLKDSELAKITATKLQIGSATAGPITVAAAINPTSLTHLYSAGSIAGAGAIKVANLAVTSTVDSVALTGTNDVDVLAATAAKDFTFADIDDLKIDSVAACVLTETGVTATVGNVALNTGKLLTLNANVIASNTITLNPTADGVTQTSGAITTSGLELKGSGTYTLTAATNDIGTIAAAVTGPISYRDVNALIVGTVNTIGITTGGSDLTLKTGGALTLAQSVNVGTGSGVFDVAAGGVNQTGGIVTAKNLELLITGAATLTATGNDVDTIAAKTTGKLQFTDTDELTVGTVNASKGINTAGTDAVIKTGNQLTLSEAVNAGAGNASFETAADGVVQSATGIVTAKGLELKGAGTVTLTQVNSVDALAGKFAGPISFTNGKVLSIGTVNGTIGVDSTGNPIALNAPGISQTAAIQGSSLDLQGAGTFNLPLAGNDVDTFSSKTTVGSVFFRDGDDLAIAPPGINTGGQAVTIQTGGSFTLPIGATIDVGAGNSGTVQAGLNDASKADTSTTITIAGIVNAHPANGFRIEGGIGSNSFDITPSKTTPLFVFGNPPTPAEVTTVIKGDGLVVQTGGLGAVVGLFNVDKINGNGAFTFTDPNNAAIEVARPLIYNSIEVITGLSIQAAAVQTSPTNYDLVVSGKFNGGPFRGGFVGTLPPVAPFLVAPQLTNPIGPFTAPEVAVGDVDGDGLPDLVVGFGLNSGSPLVTVVDGIRIFDSGKDGKPLVLADIMTQFFAYDPAFQGGVFVAAGDTNGDGRANIITGAGAGGGPHVKVFSIDPTRDPDGTFKTKSNSNAKVDSEFFAYAANFTGGVRVAAGDVNGNGAVDITTAAGAGGGPHVRVFTPTGSVQSEFFAYQANFLGGVFVDVGDYDADGFDDILTGAGFGGGPHVRVFDGEVLSKTGSQVIMNEFFDDPPSTLNPTPFQDDQSAFTAGVTGVGFGNFEDTTTQLDIFVGSGIGRRTRVRIYQNGAQTPVQIGGKPVDFLSISISPFNNGTNYKYDSRRDGAHVAVGGAFLT